MIKLALIGLGWGEQVAIALRQLPGIKLSTCFARTVSTRNAFANRFDCRTAETFESIILDGSIDGVILMTPNSTHCPLAIKAMQAGKHVLVTKPICTNLSQASEMLRTAEETGRVLFVGHQSRRHPALRTLHQLITSGTIGTPQLIEGNTSSPTGLTLSEKAWRNQEGECPGGPLLQLGIHYVDNFQNLIGMIDTVAAKLTPSNTDKDCVEAATLIVSFANGATGYLRSSYIAPHIRWLAVTGNKARAVVDTDGSLRLQHLNDGKVEIILPAVKDSKNVLIQMLAEEVEEFVSCIRRGATPEVSPMCATRNLAVVLAALEADRRQTWVG